MPNSPLMFFLQYAGAIISALMGILFIWHLISPNTVPAKSNQLWIFIACVIAILVSFAAIVRHRLHSPTLETYERSQNQPLITALKNAFQHQDKKTASQHCRLFGRICVEVSKDLYLDGSDPQPEIRTGEHLHHVRSLKRYFTLDGHSFAANYPELPKVVSEFLDAKAGKDSGPLSKEARSVWCDALHELGLAAITAAEQIK